MDALRTKHFSAARVAYCWDILKVFVSAVFCMSKVFLQAKCYIACNELELLFQDNSMLEVTSSLLYETFPIHFYEIVRVTLSFTTFRSQPLYSLHPYTYNLSFCWPSG